MKIEMKYSVEQLKQKDIPTWLSTSRPIYVRRYYFIQNGREISKFFVHLKHQTIGHIEYFNDQKIIRHLPSWKQLRNLRKIKLLKEQINKLLKETYVKLPSN